MTISDQKLITQMKNLRKLLHTGASGVQIYDGVLGIVHYLEKSDDEQVIYNGLCELLDEILNLQYIKDGHVDNKTLQFVTEKILQYSEQSNYSIWGIIFAKLYGRDMSFNHPLIFADLAYFGSHYFTNKIGSNSWFNSDFDNVDFVSLLVGLKDEFAGILQNGSSYSLYLESEPRNILAKYLYEKCSASSSQVKIFFPFSKTLIEPMLIAYIISLRYEAIHGRLPEYISFYVPETEPAFESKIQNVYQYYEEIFIKLKNSFASQNNINVKNIKTNLKTIKKRIIQKSEQELQKISFDYMIANPFDPKKLRQDNMYHAEKIIAECVEDTDLTELGLSWCSEIAKYADRDCDSMKHLMECTKIEQHKTQKTKQVKFDEIFTERLSYSRQQMKMMLAKSNFIVAQENMLKYAELLYLAGQYSKSFDLIKQHYTIDADYAYRLLNYITQNCKNNKLNQSINSFIIDRALDKEGFGQAMLEAIVDGVDDYFEENPGSVLKDKHWL